MLKITHYKLNSNTYCHNTKIHCLLVTTPKLLYRMLIKKHEPYHILILKTYFDNYFNVIYYVYTMYFSPSQPSSSPCEPLGSHQSLCSCRVQELTFFGDVIIGRKTGKSAMLRIQLLQIILTV